MLKKFLMLFIILNLICIKTYADDLAQQNQQNTQQPQSSQINELMNSGNTEVSKHNNEKAQEYFLKVLKIDSNYYPAKLGIANAKLSVDDNYDAIDYLDTLDQQSDETKALKAKAYLDLHMPDNAREEGSTIVDEKTNVEIQNKIRKEKAITITPQYSFLLQSLSQEFKLDAQKFGITYSEGIPRNSNFYFKYNAFVYTSGDAPQLKEVANSFMAGIKGRPSKGFEYDINIGVKTFQRVNHSLLNTNSYLKWYFGDNSNLKLNYYRENMESSYVAAVGKYIDGRFTGRATNNNINLEYTKNFPKNKYLITEGGFGAIYASNLPTNLYYECGITFGKTFYPSPKTKWFDKFNLDLSTYNSRYQLNLLDLYSSSGQLYGGYFSPQFFNATTINFKLEGKILKSNFKYGLKGFAGEQTYINSTDTIPAWGVTPYITYDINDHVRFSAEFDHFSYQDIQRNIFIVKLIMRGFRHAKG